MAQVASPPAVVAISSTTASRAALSRQLRAACYRVKTAPPDARAYEVLTQHRPDAIVVDADPRDAAVAQFLRGLRAPSAAPRIPVIRIGGSGKSLGDAEADFLLPSPVSRAALRQAVRTALRLRRAELRAAQAENLKNEIAHRVRGQLAMVTGLLQVQAVGQSDSRVAAALRAAVSRIRTIGELHEVMYAPKHERVPLSAILQRVAEGAREVFAGREAVELSVNGKEIDCSPAEATNLCVITHELVANALRHGGPGPDGRRRVEVETARGDGEVRLLVWGSGHPVPRGFDVQAQQGTGLRVVSDLVSQYGGSLTLRPRAGGTLAVVKLGADRLA